MRIARIDDLHCDAGWRVFSFLKITTDDGIVTGAALAATSSVAQIEAACRKPGQAHENRSMLSA